MFLESSSDFVNSIGSLTKTLIKLTDRGLGCLAGFAFMRLRSPLQGCLEVCPKLLKLTFHFLPLRNGFLSWLRQLGGLERSGHLLAVLFRRTDIARLY
ncbi:hypothetical protein GU90_09490 [Saccharopolyspora rectivirgula]|uniref:Uncharacterized protein n=1 Tax=Saccharopolyspora rectivirgula TaxID=28042 RepID=A0A073AX94_9PSEU|nr:hypothetical protein GU90_09490 [Saccharopolyspora rectivirgula]